MSAAERKQLRTSWEPESFRRAIYYSGLSEQLQSISCSTADLEHYENRSSRGGDSRLAQAASNTAPIVVAAAARQAAPSRAAQEQRRAREANSCDVCGKRIYSITNLKVAWNAAGCPDQWDEACLCPACWDDDARHLESKVVELLKSKIGEGGITKSFRRLGLVQVMFPKTSSGWSQFLKIPDDAPMPSLERRLDQLVHLGRQRTPQRLTALREIARRFEL
jgi:hypothetical protein